MGAALVLLVAAPLAGGAVTLLVGHRSDRGCALISTSSIILAWVLSVWLGWQHWGTAPPTSTVGEVFSSGAATPITIAGYLDPLSVSMLVLATSVALLVQVYSIDYLKGDPRYPSYAALVCLFTSAMTLVVVADDLIVLLVGWEVMGICSYFLIGHHWELAEAQTGAVKAFVMTHAGDVVMLFGFFVLARAAGTFRISGILHAAGSLNGATVTLATLLVLGGVVGKSAQFPLHSWLPDAMPGPTPISALIHAATMVAAGVYLVARLEPLFARAPLTLAVLAVLACVTMLGGALFALAAEDLKRVLAWSTVSQLAYMFGGLSLLQPGAAVLHLLSHGACKALLFLAAGSVITAVGTQRLDGMGGLRASLPVTFVTMTIGFAALVGVPPFVGFFSKDALLGGAGTAALTGGGFRAWLVLVTGLVVVAVTAAYSTRAWLMVFFGPSRAVPATETAPRETRALMRWPLVVLAVVAVVGGAGVWWPGFLAVPRAPLNAPVLAVSLVLIVAGGWYAWSGWARSEEKDPASWLGRFRPVLAREVGFDALWATGVVKPTYLTAWVVARAEALVVTPYARGAEAAARWGGGLLRWLHNGNAQRYATAIVVGAVAVAVLMGTVRP